MLSDIEDFTTDQLRAEIRRREEADRAGRCWYCGRNLKAHTCKHAVASPLPGWIVDPPRFVVGEDCMAREERYWQVDARNPTTGRCAIGVGPNADVALEKCVASAGRAR